MTWQAAYTYSARIGGIIYRNVRCPIALDDNCIFRLMRNSANGQLAVTFDLQREDGTQFASIVNNVVSGFDSSAYFLLQDSGRSALVERKTGRVWCEIAVPRQTSEYELDVSCIIFSLSGYPMFFHPDRSKFGTANDNKAPNISKLTITTESGHKGAAIRLDRTHLYLLSIAIENFDVGVSVSLKAKDGTS